MTIDDSNHLAIYILYNVKLLNDYIDNLDYLELFTILYYL